MAITLDTINLPDDLIWQNEYNYSSVSQSVQKSLTGALIIQEARQQKGRKITLAGNDTTGWTDKATLDALYAKYDVADTVMTLNYHGRVFSVMFDRSTSGGIIARQLYDASTPDATHPHVLTLNFIEV